MEIIRYGISRDDLHGLLRTIGVLQVHERVISVAHADPLNSGSDMVIVTVSTAPTRSPGEHTTMTDKELQQRMAELQAMSDAATEELRLIADELDQLGAEIEHRHLDGKVGDDGIPDVVAKNIRSQIRDILSGRFPNADDATE